MINIHKAMWSLIFSMCLILALACGGGAGGGAAATGPNGGSNGGQGGQPGRTQGGGAGLTGGGQAGGQQGGGQAAGGPQGGAGPAAGSEQGSGPGAGRENGGPGVAGASQPGAGPGAAVGGQVGGNVSAQDNANGAAADAISEAAADGSASTDYEANETIEQYARDVLGISVTITGSGAREGDVNVPISTESDLEATASVAGVTYAATLRGGAASVSLGSGDVSGDLEADIQSVSLGSFSLIQAGRTAGDENSALDLIKATYPGIADLPYTAKDVSSQASAQGEGGQQVQGETYTFIAQTQQNEVDVKTGQATVIAVAALVGVTSTEGQAIVYAVVGRGDLATSIR